jgi:phenylpropionate dioxygenase-like ring-hydroxylating dioxygenase large terminal subunit
MSEGKARRAPSSEEVGRALRRCWQPVARTQDLKDGPQRAVLLGEALAVFLTEDEEAAVVADRCPHRGASLSMGKVVGGAIQCPYHGWEWDGGDGGCVRVPSLADQTQRPPRARVEAYPVREQWGLVWTALERPLGEPPTVPWFDPDEWEWGHGEPFELPVSFGVMIENFRDVAHFAFVHRATLGAVPEVVEPLHVVTDHFEVTMSRAMRSGAGAEEIWGTLCELRNHVIAPNFTSSEMIHSTGKRCLLHVARAVSATESVHYWLEGLSAEFDEFTLPDAIEAEHRLYEEDREIASAVSPPELGLDLSAEPSTLADRFTLAYRQAFAEYVSEALAERRTS